MERNTDITNSEGQIRDDTALGIGHQTDQSGTRRQEMIDLTNNEEQIAHGDRDIEQSHNKSNRKINYWIGEDITAIVETRQHAHIHKSAQRGNVLMFSRDIRVRQH